MIPLRSSHGEANFPRATAVLVLSLGGLDILSRLWPGPRLDFLLRVAFYPAAPSGTGGLSCLFFPHLFALVVGLLFVWVFTPRLFAQRGIIYVAALGLSGVAVALGGFRWIHPFSNAPLLSFDAALGAWLGAYMRRDIWGSVSTLVIGPGWLRIFEVPSYVLLFFWFFYLFVGNLFLADAFSNAPMLYWLPFAAFLWGFVFESIRGGWRRAEDTAAKTHD